MAPAALRSRTTDAACAEAVDLARDAAVAAVPSPDSVGEHLTVQPDGDRVVTHLFACADLAYRGWRWAVTVTRAPRSRKVTVSEVTLLPGTDAIVPPAWLPWEDRIRPGDLGPGDLLPTPPDDLRLQPGYAETGEDADAATWWEPGLGRIRVLSAEGREDAAERWYDGDRGPRAPIAEQAPGRCATCGFFVPLGGSLRQVFGVCANELVPDDGNVVSLDHGCGGHSEAVGDRRQVVVDVTPTVDEESFDVLEVPRPESDDEPLGHS